MATESQQSVAKAFVSEHLPALATDVLVWRNRGVLPASGQLHVLANLCIPIASKDEEYQVAETLIVQVALEHAAARQK